MYFLIIVELFLSENNLLTYLLTYVRIIVSCSEEYTFFYIKANYKSSKAEASKAGNTAKVFFHDVITCSIGVYDFILLKSCIKISK